MSGAAPRDPLETFRAVFWQDVRSGSKRSLVEFLTLFPGNEVGIAREYAAIHDAWAEGREPAAADPTTPDRTGTQAERRGSRIDGLLEEGVIGPYRLERRLGRGGQGIVYLAEDQRLRRKVALKVLPMMETDDFARLRREAEIAARIEHPGICPIYHVGRDRGLAYIAMRFVAGESLAARLETLRGGGNPGPPSTFTLDVEAGPAGVASEPPPARPVRAPPAPEIGPVLDLMAQVARIVHGAHEEGIIHRDLKPGNIMIAPDGASRPESAAEHEVRTRDVDEAGRVLRGGEKPIVLDFGLARDENERLTTLAVSGQPFGTRPYMSPEQVLGRRSEFGRATDVWSLGVTLFECLTLRWPFADGPGTSLYESILNHPVPDARQWNQAVPEDVVEVLRVAMAKEPASRYASAFSLAEDLERAKNRRRVLGTTASMAIVKLDPTEGGPPAAPAGDEESGRRFGNYLIRQELGRGDLGVVHLAWDTHLGRNVALKLFRLDPADWQRKLQHARHEAEVTARLENPAICAIYDTGVDGDTSYIAMRYVEGASLAQEIERAARGGRERTMLPLRSARSGGPEGALALAVICRWFADAARVLHQVHEAGIIHRDLKPGNLMITPALEPVLLGLGCADADTPYAETLFNGDTLPGTPAYMSPEKIRTCTEDRRGDVWSLGATLYECLALRPAFSGATWKEVFEHILVRPPPDLRTICGPFPPEFLRVVDRALAKDPTERQATAADLALDLQTVAAGLGEV